MTCRIINAFKSIVKEKQDNCEIYFMCNKSDLYIDLDYFIEDTIDVIGDDVHWFDVEHFHFVSAKLDIVYDVVNGKCVNKNSLSKWVRLLIKYCNN